MNINDCRALMAAHNETLKRLVAEQRAFIEANRGRAEKRIAAQKEFKHDRENMFTGIFKFRMENFHSEMLRQFLDPRTPDIGDGRFLRVFLRLLEKINPHIKTAALSERVTVECEKSGGKKADGRIDLLISDDTHAVIIENKINNAPDQPNQLAKYVKAVKAQGKEILAVVYIPPFGGGGPPLEAYDEAWQEYVPEIERKLAVLPALDRRRLKEEANDIASGFIGECLRAGNLKGSREYMLSQYAKLLQTMEGEPAMAKTIDREFIEGFYKDKKSIETLEHMCDVWDNREGLLGDLVRRPIWDSLKKDGYEEEEGEEWRFSLFKTVIKNKLWLAFYSDPDDGELHIGFWYEGKVKGKVKDALEEAMNDALPEAYFESSNDWGDPENSWLTRKFWTGEYKEPLDEIKAYFLGRCKALEKAAAEITV